MTFAYTYSPTYEQRVNKGQADGYVGLVGTVLSPSGLTASNLNLLGTVGLAANAYIRFDEDAGINDSTGSKVWKFNRSNITSNNVATLGDVTNLVNSLGTVPIGAIIAWHKTFTHTPALPAQFVERNGQTLSDAGSIYNGQAIPNLNGNNNFLRGSSTSGGTGGAAVHTHDVDLSLNLTTVSGADSSASVPFPGTFTTDSADNIPPYTDMVWIMRIK